MSTSAASRDWHRFRRLASPAMALLFAVLPAERAVAQDEGLCTRPRPRPVCTNYIDLEFQLGTRFGAGVVAMRNVGDSVAFGASVLAMIHNRSPGGIAVELRRRRWFSRKSAVDIALGPLWAQTGGGGRNRTLPNGAVGGINLMHNEHIGLFGRVSHMRRRGEAPETRLGVGVQTGSRAGIPTLLIAAGLMLGWIRIVSGGT